MKKLSTFLFLVAAFVACRQESNTGEQAQLEQAPSLSLVTEDQAEWQFQDLRLYPILASDTYLSDNAAAGELKTLAEAIETYGFRISEKKPFGRFEDSGAVNNLTVQNKTGDAVFLMSGDIVRGGRQDRVVGEDQIIAARSLKDIPVFCVEQGRWQFEGETENEEDVATRQDQVFAFSGYYHVAAGDIRNTLATSKNQQEVWDKVSRITSHYAIDSHTGAYASLESSEDFTRERDAYVRFFADKFTDMENMVGILAVSGKQIIATDIFGHPDLLQRQLPSLLHSYATDAVTLGEAVAVSDRQLQKQIDRTNKAVQTASLTRYKGAITHHFVKAPGE
ncbi:ARPP-1 family domain-containing protein [Flavilitoribacter nigricans]|uniref:ARG and Rhodanese-Phosphatase-superfamily-associated domain-containing protein n=1 Tax=Flavilitoribacter nigricans (strain ATCC 23147 / DSM 23189 / NBRC 102662 / NCIMB 1420 / SS-2) TaxID=1122177 RepID=A0A2D0NBF5_FLAN2|nr:DUF6569 family protein [Flavilitoribacter nigricans]PHN05841.1 hypothetical protein CRP01_15335 [Flavilitoribacter nigricans DSM 23189 = NBRC 102662]